MAGLFLLGPACRRCRSHRPARVGEAPHPQMRKQVQRAMLGRTGPCSSLHTHTGSSLEWGPREDLQDPARAPALSGGGSPPPHHLDSSILVPRPPQRVLTVLGAAGDPSRSRHQQTRQVRNAPFMHRTHGAVRMVARGPGVSEQPAGLPTPPSARLSRPPAPAIMEGTWGALHPAGSRPGPSCPLSFSTE